MYIYISAYNANLREIYLEKKIYLLNKLNKFDKYIWKIYLLDKKKTDRVLDLIELKPDIFHDLQSHFETINEIF